MSSFSFWNARCAVAGFFRALANTSKRMKNISAHAEEMMEALKDFDEKMEKEVRDLSKEEGWTLVDAYIERESTSALKSASCLKFATRAALAEPQAAWLGIPDEQGRCLGRPLACCRDCRKSEQLCLRVWRCVEGRRSRNHPQKNVENWISYNVGKTIKYKPSPSHHHVYRWYVYNSQSWVVYDIVFFPHYIISITTFYCWWNLYFCW